MAASKGYMHHLSMAACEWFLMFLMFIDAALAYILTKFAHHCELQTPCLFCLRLDHVFGNENPGSYLSLFCSKHLAEISSLISCDLHDTVANVREICDDCFNSIMEKKQSNHESYGYPKSYLNRNIVRVPSSSGTCSCCKTQWEPNPSASMLQPGPVRLGVSKATMKPPPPRTAGCSRFRRRNIFKRVRDKISGTSIPCHVENDIDVDDDDLYMDPLSDSGCADPRFSSDSESESSFYEIDDDGDDDPTPTMAVLGNKKGSEDDSHGIHGTSGPNLDQARAERSHNVSDPKPASLTSNGSIEHNGPEITKETRPSPSRGSIQDLHSISDKIDDDPTPTTAVLGNKKGSEDDSHGIHVTSGPDLDQTRAERSHNVSDPNPASLTSNSSIPIEHNSPPEVSKETRSSPKGSIQDLHSISDRINDDHEASSSSYESDGYESLSEIDGESVVDKLKRQVEHGRERLRVLNEELEEERNAAGVAADEAMAMITRLQEEKAALHMEALQYLRMMDEQAEYDMEAVEKANDLVAEKDKEIQDLEAELEYLRSHYDDQTEYFKGVHIGNGKKPDFSSSNSKFDKLTSFNPPVLGLEDEKRYILHCLSELERKFHQFSSEETSIGKSNGNIHAEKTTKELGNQENSFSRNKDSSKSNGSKNSLSGDGDEVDAGTLENEISDLNQRLEALEADRDFLEHACNTLKSNGGLEFIQEIAHHLQDLRMIRFDGRCQSVA